TIDNTFELDSRDAGFNGHYVVYKAEDAKEVAISGGQSISAWSEQNGLFVANTGDLNFRQLYVNGQRATRARTPNKGEVYQTKIWDLANQTLLISANYIERWNNFSDVEMAMKMWWTDAYLRLKDFSVPQDSLPFAWLPRYAAVTFQEPEQSLAFKRLFPPKINDIAFHFENAMEFLDQPGEWYLNNATHKLYYKPREGETLSKLTAIAPRVETLLKVEGTLAQPVHHVKFQGIRFCHATWLRPSETGHLVCQAGQYVVAPTHLNYQYVGRPASAVLVKAANNIVFEQNVFEQLGATAIDMHYGASDNVINGNLIKDIAGNGIAVGKINDPDHEIHIPWNPADKREISRHNIISNNYITRVGCDYFGAIGIVAGYTDSVIIEHNEIWDCPYTGISVGWGWTAENTPLKDNKIRYNHIHHVLQELCDGAGIYILSRQPGTHVYQNYIHDIKLAPTALGTINSGIYLDEYSDGITVEMNWMEKIMNDPIFNIKTNTTLHITLIKNELWADRFYEDNQMVINNAGPVTQFQAIKSKL
ncbi:MAG: right-handed parallel beta-helix repeat-containing protein, partial [Bacteroidales bacterium]|nr:right-handed parallel beta-helix repeat-containing protein [Bacteroidales bacterium]